MLLVFVIFSVSSEYIVIFLDAPFTFVSSSLMKVLLGIELRGCHLHSRDQSLPEEEFAPHWCACVSARCFLNA